MAGSGRTVGRPAYDSKQKLVAATCALLAERGYEATSPQMILQRAGIGQGSMYHHYRGKEDLAFDAIAHMRGRTTAFLEGQHDQLADTDGEAAAVTIVENALAGCSHAEKVRRSSGCSPIRRSERSSLSPKRHKAGATTSVPLSLQGCVVTHQVTTRASLRRQRRCSALKSRTLLRNFSQGCSGRDS